MAIIDCEECGKPMSSKAAACPFCGSPPPKGIISKIARAIGILVVAFIGITFFLVVRGCNEGTKKASEGRLPTANQPLPQPQKKAEAVTAPLPQEPMKAPSWAYETKTDQISGKTFPYATLRSSNTNNLSFPYGPGIGAELVLRRATRGPDFALLAIDKGQLLCHTSDPCIAIFKFDNRDEKLIRARHPGAGASDAVIFEYSFSEILDDVRRARHLMIEVPVYKDGRQVWKFDVDGFDPKKL